MGYRHEWKIALAPGDLAVLRQRLQTVMQPDVHAVDGRYGIRSLYFDTPEDRALREKLDGVSRREKFRIRYYNGDRSFIQLEKKCKCAGLGRKEQARSIAAGRFDAVGAGADALLGEFCRKARAGRPAGSGRRSARRCCWRRSGLPSAIKNEFEGLGTGRIAGPYVFFGGRLGCSPALIRPFGPPSPRGRLSAGAGAPPVSLWLTAPS